MLQIRSKYCPNHAIGLRNRLEHCEARIQNLLRNDASHFWKSRNVFVTVEAGSTQGQSSAIPFPQILQIEPESDCYNYSTQLSDFYKYFDSRLNVAENQRNWYRHDSGWIWKTLIQKLSEKFSFENLVWSLRGPAISQSPGLSSSSAYQSPLLIVERISIRVPLFRFCFLFAKNTILSEFYWNSLEMNGIFSKSSPTETLTILMVLCSLFSKEVLLYY